MLIPRNAEMWGSFWSEFKYNSGDTNTDEKDIT